MSGKHARTLFVVRESGSRQLEEPLIRLYTSFPLQLLCLPEQHKMCTESPARIESGCT